MNKSLHAVPIIILFLLLLFPLAPLQSYSLTPNPPLWTTPDPVADLAISGNGSIVVISNYSHVKVFDGDGNVLWTYTLLNESFFATAVDVSRNGNAVVASFFNGSHSRVLFWKDAASLSGMPTQDWMSEVQGIIGLEGLPPIVPFFVLFMFFDTLAISGDGNQVVAGLANLENTTAVLYWNNTLSLTGTVDPTWSNTTITTTPPFITHVDTSFNGNYVAAGLVIPYTGAWLLYFKNAVSKSGSIMPDLGIPVGFFIANITGLELSDDGKYAVLSYFNNASGWSLYYYNFTDSPYRFWETEFGSTQLGGVDISSDGSVVVTTVGGFILAPIIEAPLSSLKDMIDIGNLNLKEYKQKMKPNYTLEDSSTPSISFYHVPSDVPNGTMLMPDVNVTVEEPLGSVSLSCDGSVAVAGNYNGTIVYAATSSGTLIWSDYSTIDPISHRVKVSCNGEVAATGGISFDSLHYYRVRPQVAVVGGEAEISLGKSNQIALLAIPILLAIAIYLINRKSS